MILSFIAKLIIVSSKYVDIRYYDKEYHLDKVCI